MATTVLSASTCGIPTKKSPYPSAYIPSNFKSNCILGKSTFISEWGNPLKSRCIKRIFPLLSNVGMPLMPPSLQYHQNSMTVSASAAAASSSPTTSTSSSVSNDAEYLEERYGGKGIKFGSIADMCVIGMKLENGSSARLVLPSGLITSYKPLMWHGGCVELLHTIVTRDSNGEPTTAVQGGIAPVLNHLNQSAAGGSSWSARDWAVEDVSADPEDYVQVTLTCSNGDGMLSVQYVVTLYDRLLATALLVDNNSTSSIKLTGSVMSHLTLSTPDGAYAVGLKGCPYCTQPPLSSTFNIISQISSDSKAFSVWSVLQRLFGIEQKSNKSDSKTEEIPTGDSPAETTWAVEGDDYAHLKNKMSRVYSTPLDKFIINDRGKRYSVVLGKIGFEEFYLSSPGSNSRFYGKDSYICTGPASMLQPVVLTPGGKWRAAQVLENPNI